MARDEKRIFIIQKNHLHFHALYVHKCAYLEQMFVVKCSNCNFRRKFNVYLKLIYIWFMLCPQRCVACVYIFKYIWLAGVKSRTQLTIICICMCAAPATWMDGTTLMLGFFVFCFYKLVAGKCREEINVRSRFPYSSVY